MLCFIRNHRVNMMMWPTAVKLTRKWLKLRKLDCIQILNSERSQPHRNKVSVYNIYKYICTRT